jgi:hypothetical protein
VEINLKDSDDFDAAFGPLGQKVGSRIGPHKRSQEDKEWYVIRRFLRHALSIGMFRVPLSVSKGQPPLPDFVMRVADIEVFVEITEATPTSDQKEMTEMELSNKQVMFWGSCGGRLSKGASESGKAWARDIFEAIERKTRKSIFADSHAHRHLIIYPNSIDSRFLGDDDDEQTAFAYLTEMPASKREALVRVANGCSVHVLGEGYIIVDVLGRAEVFRSVHQAE